MSSNVSTLRERVDRTNHGAVLEQLGTISPLQEESLSLGYASEMSPKADDLSRSDERREVSKSS